MKYLLATFCFSLLLLSCSGIKDPKFRDIENLRVHKFGLANSSLKMDLRYLNPNRFGLKLLHAEGDAWMDNNFLGHFKMDSAVYIGPGADFLLPVKLELDMSKFLKNSVLAILSPEIELKVEGKARLGKGGININYPFHYKGRHDIRKLIQ
jgi:LEA14-like dessication related protein